MTDLPEDPPATCLCGSVLVLLPAPLQIKDLPPRWREYATQADATTISIETGCHAPTSRSFAPGHDARFKSLMRLAVERAGTVEYEDEQAWDPIDLVRKIAPNLEAAVLKLARPAPARRPRQRRGEPQPRAVRAKVGAREYDGEIYPVGPGPDPTEHFHYRDGNGANKVAGAFTIIKEYA